MIERVNMALLELKEEGTFVELSEKYFGEILWREVINLKELRKMWSE